MVNKLEGTNIQYFMTESFYFGATHWTENAFTIQKPSIKYYFISEMELRDLFKLSVLVKP